MRSILAKEPYFVHRYRCPSFTTQLQALIRDYQPDTVHLDTIPMVQYRSVVPSGIRCIASINDSYTLTLDNAFADSSYRGLEHIYRSFQYRLVRRYESSVLADCDAVHLMSATDARYLARLNPAISTIVIPNGVDDSLFTVENDPTSTLRAVFIGHLAKDNLLALTRFLKHGWPIVRQHCPDITLQIVGNAPPEARNECARIVGDNSISFLGYVQSLVDAYRGCQIAIVPVNKNCGVLNKAVEAMAAGLAVVGFTRSFEGIPGARDGTHFIGVSDFAGFGNAVAAIAHDRARLAAIQQAARQLARTSWSWSSRRAEYDSMYRPSTPGSGGS
jgi:glycosyltransferase involved in cell wall biosynthesis